MKKFIPSIVFGCVIAVIAFAQPVLRNVATTNTSPVVLTQMTNAGAGAISVDITKQSSSIILSNYVSAPKFTGIVTNANSLGQTNFMEFSAGILTNVVIGAHP